MASERLKHFWCFCRNWNFLSFAFKKHFWCFASHTFQPLGYSEWFLSLGFY